MSVHKKEPLLRLSLALGVTALFAVLGVWVAPAQAIEHPIVDESAVSHKYVMAPPAPRTQSEEDMQRKSVGCLSCHTKTDQPTMHVTTAIRLGCTDCHGGNPTVMGTGARESKEYAKARDNAHIMPRYPKAWNYPSSANPERSYTLLNRESPEFVRFVNPGDYRIADLSCGVCHGEVLQASVRSMHSTGVMLWGGASYNNGILPYKKYVLGESYTIWDRNKPADKQLPWGVGQLLKGPNIPASEAGAAAAADIIPSLAPMPAWETLPPADVFRIFERGGRNILNTFPETGLPDSLGLLQRLEEPGRPDFRQSSRGMGTGARIAVPVINITKTRLNDPFTWYMGTNDNPGDYRSSGCSSCHVVYANDRDPKHAGPYAQFGHEGKTQTIDPTISKTESGHPLQHTFTRSVPTSQCMICHMHQPNMFMNSMLGYTMWDYESDAPAMWPEKQKYPTDHEIREIEERNPEGAAAHGKWGDPKFLSKVADLNPSLHDTQFADYHGHGWNFRAVFKRDRVGNLLDSEGRIVRDDDPQKFQKSVHMSSIHIDLGMHCVDCHYSQDMHGNGYIYGEVAAAVEIDCKDCHGTANNYPNLYASGPAALGGGTDLTTLRTPDGRRRFEWVNGQLYQRSMMEPNKEWRVSLVKDTVTPGNRYYNPRAARAKLMSKDTSTLAWGQQVPVSQQAHSNDKIECYTCHTSWTTSCGGCHLPIEANWKSERLHYEGGETRNFATYNPQVARDEMFLIGKREPSAGGRWAPVRSSSALVLSSTNANREHIYVQQPPVSASGYSSQAFNPHYPHTERKTETKTCSDCHLSRDNDNNAIMAQLLMQGTNFVNFVGYHVYMGGQGEVNAVQVTEWDEPQAVIGSYLHKYAYPDFYAEHQKNGGRLQKAESIGGTGDANCVMLRGEYLYVAEGNHGMRVYDVASIGNKGVSEKIINAPDSPLGQHTDIPSKDATCVALPTNQPVDPARPDRLKQVDLMRKDNLENPMHPMYRYAYITDAKEGLILTPVDTLTDREPRNNFLKRALTWNPGGVLNGAKHLTIAGTIIYIATPKGIEVVSIDDPLKPKVVAEVPLQGVTSTAVQFRYLFVTDAKGLEVVDVTNPEQPQLIPDNVIPLASAHRVYVARTYAYVAAGAEGLAIVDVTRPSAMRLYTKYTADGRVRDVRDVIVATTNASLFAYIADGAAGLKILQLTSPESQPKFYGFSPEPKPQLIAWYPTSRPALSLSKGLDRDRGVDESGNQIAVFGRRGSRPPNLKEMQSLYLDAAGKPWYVTDGVQVRPGVTVPR